MFIGDPGATPLDLRFRLFGTNVRVTLWFWLGAVLFGWGYTLTNDPYTGHAMGDLLVWIVCVFISVLLHEFGHVWMGQVFGSHGHILLHGMGGLAIGSSDLRQRWKRILVSAAGPGIQLLLYAALCGLWYAGFWPQEKTPLLLLLRMLLYVNLAWPILNLLPIWPLDGGWITRDVGDLISERRGIVVALWISFVVAALLAVNALLWETQLEMMAGIARNLIKQSYWLGRAFIYTSTFSGWYLVIFFALLAVGSYQSIQEMNRRQRHYWEDDDRVPWER